MKNPCLPYPGRQIFVGTLPNGLPAFGYLVTGRSPESQQRRAEYRADENAVRILPLDPDATFDPLRHYRAVKINPESNVLVVSNSEAPVDELLAKPDDMRGILKKYGPEPDASRTPRIACTIYRVGDIFVRHLGIVTADRILALRSALNQRGSFSTVSTYGGRLEDPLASLDTDLLLGHDLDIVVESTAPNQLADELYEISHEPNPRGDMRVCTVTGALNNKSPVGWELAIKNRFGAK